MKNVSISDYTILCLDCSAQIQNESKKGTTLICQTESIVVYC